MLNSIEDEIDLKEYFAILKKNKFFILLICLAFFIVTLITNLLLPKTYSASGKIFINRKKMELKMEPKFQTYSNEEVNYETYVDLLKNNELLDDVIKQLNLNMTTQEIGRMITIDNSSSSGKVDILRITVDTNNPTLAKDIANEILKKYVLFFQQLYTSNPREVKYYVQKQMDISKEQLETEENNLNKFSRENSLDLIKQEIQDNLEKLSSNKKLLTTVKLEADELKYKLDQLKKESENNNLFLSSPLAEAQVFYQELKKKLINLDITLAETKQSYSEHHPKYQEIHITIEKTKEKISDVIQATINNYAFKLNNLQDKERILRETISNAEKNILNFQTKMAEYELKFDRLQRNQKLAAQSYTMLATKIEEVKIEDKVQPTLMKIIEYATTPQSPTKPRVIRNVGLFSILGFFVAIFLAFFKEYFEN